MPVVRTEKEQIAAGLLAQVSAQRQKNNEPGTPRQPPKRGE
jgi:hypothetical protein